MIAFKVFRYANIGIYGVKMLREVLINVNFPGLVNSGKPLLGLRITYDFHTFAQLETSVSEAE